MHQWLTHKLYPYPRPLLWMPDIHVHPLLDISWMTQRLFKIIRPQTESMIFPHISSPLQHSFSLWKNHLTVVYFFSWDSQKQLVLPIHWESPLSIDSQKSMCQVGRSVYQKAVSKTLAALSLSSIISNPSPSPISSTSLIALEFIYFTPSPLPPPLSKPLGLGYCHSFLTSLPMSTLSSYILFSSYSKWSISKQI